MDSITTSQQRLSNAKLWVLPIQLELLSVERTIVSKVVLAWDFYRYPSPIYRYNQSTTDTLRYNSSQ
ncbi:hypothetical protein Goari_011187 [Gossypium aridum]|uniref:Uncharacterized protein n=1 Tax=Gossypium aridum TaxID=34290 RepID=A0A7J8WXZ5_GOSAI|nr:hypothetical protein [Gossypium aridum]